VNQGVRDRVTAEEIERALVEQHRQRLADARAVMATKEGRRLLHWVMFDAGGLQRQAPAEQRAVAIAVHDLLDAARPCGPAEIALEGRTKRKADEADIQSAIENRRHEYE
jgi:hypothetical protein